MKIVVSRDQRALVDRWISRQPDPVTPHDAIVQLVGRGLYVELDNRQQMVIAKAGGWISSG
jgi:hypothetical protein